MKLLNQIKLAAICLTVRERWKAVRKRGMRTQQIEIVYAHKHARTRERANTLTQFAPVI